MVVYILWCSEVSLVEAHTKKNSGHVLFTTRDLPRFLLDERKIKSGYKLYSKEKKEKKSTSAESKEEPKQDRKPLTTPRRKGTG